MLAARFSDAVEAKIARRCRLLSVTKRNTNMTNLISFQYLLVLALVILWGVGQEITSAAEHTPDKPATHNMLVVGERALYLSHLPMFQEEGESMPHRYQVVLEIALAKQGGDPHRDYLEDRQKHRSI